MQLRNIKQVRAELAVWGRFWFGQEQLQGYARRSACDKLNDVCTNSDGHLYENEINCPPLVMQYDKLIDAMLPECKRALRAYYVCGRTGSCKELKVKDVVERHNWALMGFVSKKEYEFWLRRAEMQLL